MCTCIKLFLRPPLTQCYFCQFYRNFNKLWIIHWTPETGTPTDPTGSPEHRKNHLDEVQAGSGTITHQEIYACYMFLLYCTVWLMIHLQGVALRSQYSDPTPEVVTLQ